MPSSQFFEVARRVSEVLSEIPMGSWDEVVRREPETELMDQLPRYGFGRFATLMTMAALNDYQLKGPAEIAYWPQLHALVSNSRVPETPRELKDLLKDFYMREKFKVAKLKRLDKFLDSPLAGDLWTSSPEWVSGNFSEIWLELARVMKQKKDAKTIVFAMKTLGIVLILVGYRNFDFSRIPIPVDVRVRRLTSRLTGTELKDKDVRMFWGEVLKGIRTSLPDVNMIHLDSLVWQVAGYRDCTGMEAYFRGLSLPEVGPRFCDLIMR